MKTVKIQKQVTAQSLGASVSTMNYMDIPLHSFPKGSGIPKMNPEHKKGVHQNRYRGKTVVILQYFITTNHLLREEIFF